MEHSGLQVQLLQDSVQVQHLKFGAIACWNDGGYGHVAVVTAVSSSTSIQVSESNYGGNRTIGNKRGWFNPTTTSEGFVTYIYPN